MLATGFEFLDVARCFALVDEELELVEPEGRHVEEMLRACQHPATRELLPAQGKMQRADLEKFLAGNPRGRTEADPARQVEAGYTFWMRMRQGVVPRDGRPAADLVMVGSISLRIGHSVNLDWYLGHIGYHVMPSARGHHYASRAARLLLPVARAHGHDHLWITCNPENIGSRRTCEALGARYVDTVMLPKENPLYKQGEREKCRYRLEV